MKVAMPNNHRKRDGLLLISGAAVGGVAAYLLVGSILGAFMGWMSGGAAGSSVMNFLNGKTATPYLFLLSALLLAAAVVGIGRINLMWIVMLVLAGMMSSGIASQIEKENLDAR
jgi:hypothetical protein